MAIFTWVPDYDATEESEARVSVAKYGDGYSQRVANGINNIDVKWTLAFTLRTRDEVSAIKAFLEAHDGANPFQWMPPGDATLKYYVCSKWSRVLRTDADSAISMSFEQVPG